jgi:hypothetical protein
VKSNYVYWEAARVLGTLLGESLYKNFRNNNFSQEQVFKWLAIDFSRKQFSQQYYDLINTILSSNNSSVKIETGYKI